MSSFIRYPGGKSKIKKDILNKININPNVEFRECFFGAGTIGLNLLDKIKKIWINDLDVGIYSLWNSVINHSEELKELVLKFNPSVKYFYEFKEELTSNIEIHNKEKMIEIGFKKLAIHQISYSGLGTMSGGPLGGKEQKSIYKIDCRWSPEYICKKIDLLNNKFSNISVKCTNFDFEKIINDNNESFIYLDPPYYDKGNSLYQCGFSENDHIRLANCLKKTNNKWLLSYDDCDEIRNLYHWANIEKIQGINYTITSLKIDTKRVSSKKDELLISN